MEVKVDWDITSPNPERGVCRAARNDYYEGDVGGDTFEEIMEEVDGTDIDEKMYHLLTDTLLKKEHYGPFEHPQIAVMLKGVSRVTMAQITRHRHMSFDIQSMRYVNFEDADVATPESMTNPEHSTRSEGLIWYDMDSDVPLEEQEPDVEAMEEARETFEEGVEDSLEKYQELVDMGIPPEDARYVIPLGTKVNIYMSGNLRSFMHVLNMRGKGDAQWEIRNLSEMIVDELEEWAPYTAQYFEENGPFKLGM